jgi:hypothetical protein
MFVPSPWNAEVLSYETPWQRWKWIKTLLNRSCFIHYPAFHFAPLWIKPDVERLNLSISTIVEAVRLQDAKQEREYGSLTWFYLCSYLILSLSLSFLNHALSSSENPFKCQGQMGKQ